MKYFGVTETTKSEEFFAAWTKFLASFKQVKIDLALEKKKQADKQNKQQQHEAINVGISSIHQTDPVEKNKDFQRSKSKPVHASPKTIEKSLSTEDFEQLNDLLKKGSYQQIDKNKLNRSGHKRNQDTLGKQYNSSRETTSTLINIKR